MVYEFMGEGNWLESLIDNSIFWAIICSIIWTDYALLFELPWQKVIIMVIGGLVFGFIVKEFWFSKL